MNGAIVYSGQYGSTAQYAQWISETTGLPSFDLKKENPDPSNFDFLVLGSSIFIGKLTICNWVKTNWNRFKDVPLMLYSVSASGPENAEFQNWIDNSLPKEMIERMKFVSLPGRLDVNRVSWWTKLLLKVGAMGEKDPNAKKRMLAGFDDMDKSSITPIVEWIRQFETASVT